MSMSKAQLETEVLESTLAWHLTANHYPPLSTLLIGPCKEAIINANFGQWKAAIRLPDGFKRKWVSTDELVYECHLDGFIDD